MIVEDSNGNKVEAWDKLISSEARSDAFGLIRVQSIDPDGIISASWLKKGGYGNKKNTFQIKNLKRSKWQLYQPTDNRQKKYPIEKNKV